MEQQHVAKVEEGRERREEGGDVGDAVEALVEALYDVGDELGIGDGRTDLGEGVSHLLLQVKVLGDGPILLLDVVELLGEINLMALFCCR